MSNSLFESIKVGSVVTIDEDEKRGRAVMKGPAGWVLNMGGEHGIPAIATPENVVAVGSRRRTEPAPNLKRDAEELYEVARRIARGGPDAGKVEFHKHGKRFLRAVLKRLGVEGDVRSILGGPAVTGEVVLHTDHVYVCLMVSAVGDRNQFMYRSCSGRKDYSGGTNRWYYFHTLANHPEDFVQVLDNIIQLARS